MDTKQDMLALLHKVAQGEVSVEQAFTKLKMEPFEDLNYAKVDFHRGFRQGYQEVIYGASKTIEHIEGIVSAMEAKGCVNIIITRIDADVAEKLAKSFELDYDSLSRHAIAIPRQVEKQGSIVIATGGTSDIGVAEEAARTAEAMGSNVTRLYDVGVAGIHRLLSNLEPLMTARVVVAVAGMEGALASVVGGLVDCPVIAVPTSVGYGASFGGVTALLSMLNSCASGVSVVNIDNGFGAGFLAGRINLMGGIAK